MTFNICRETCINLNILVNRSITNSSLFSSLLFILLYFFLFFKKILLLHRRHHPPLLFLLVLIIFYTQLYIALVGLPKAKRFSRTTGCILLVLSGTLLDRKCLTKLCNQSKNKFDKYK